MLKIIYIFNIIYNNKFLMVFIHPVFQVSISWIIDMSKNYCR